MRAGAIPERSITALPTVAPRSVAGTSFSDPPKVPIAVRSGVETIMSAAPLPKPIVHYLSVRNSPMTSDGLHRPVESVSSSWLDVLQPYCSSCDDSAALVGDADVPQLLGSSLLNGCGGDGDGAGGHRAEEVRVVVGAYRDLAAVGHGGGRADAGGAFDGCGVDAAMDHAPGGVVCRAEIDHAFHPIRGDVGKPESGGRQEGAGVVPVWCTRRLCSGHGRSSVSAHVSSQRCPGGLTP